MPHGLDSLRDLAGAMGEAPARLVVVPSTRSALELARIEAARRDTLIVADPAVAPDAVSPADYLARAAHGKQQNLPAPSAFVFSDQFVEAPFAPLLVDHSGTRTFLPSLEVLARGRYGVSVGLWQGDGFVDVPGECATDPRPVLRALLRYYEACGVLGIHWLMAHRQALRGPAARLDRARQRLRCYQSAVLQANLDAPLDGASRALMDQLAAARQGLADLRADHA